jgi:hypothetical protein
LALLPVELKLLLAELIQSVSRIRGATHPTGIQQEHTLEQELA